MTLTMESPAIGPAKTPGNTQNFVSGLRGRDMLCFSHDWTGDPLSKNHLMRVLAKHNRILWVNSIGYRTPSLTSGRDISRIFKKLRAFATPVKEVEKNIFVLNPLAIPFYGPMGSAINRKLLQLQVRRQMKKSSALKTSSTGSSIPPPVSSAGILASRRLFITAWMNSPPSPGSLRRKSQIPNARC